MKTPTQVELIEALTTLARTVENEVDMDACSARLGQAVNEAHRLIASALRASVLRCDKPPPTCSTCGGSGMVNTFVPSPICAGSGDMENWPGPCPACSKSPDH